MGETKKLKTDKLFKKFGKRKWLIDCEDRYLEDLLTIFEAEGVVWFDDEKIYPKETAKLLKRNIGYVFEFKKRKHFQFNPHEYYTPSYHYRTFTFHEFYQRYRKAKIKDADNLLNDKIKQSR